MNMHLNRRHLLLVTATLALGAGCATGVPAGPRTVLVAGATGQTGQLVVQELRTQGFAIRALVRDADKARATLGEDVELMVGDVQDPASLAPAMRGADAVISTIGARGAKGPDSPEAIDYSGVRNLVEAAAAARVQQFVLVSSRGATQEDNALNRMFGNVLIWKLKGEDALRASGVAYTVIRPGGLINVPGGDKAIMFEQGDPVVRDSTIARADLARICVAALQHPEARNRTFETSSLPGSPATDWQALFAALTPDAR